eukprot:scaffold19696_cov128-Isochrysis_galbana.AAC.7
MVYGHMGYGAVRRPALCPQGWPRYVLCTHGQRCIQRLASATAVVRCCYATIRSHYAIRDPTTS